MSAAAKEPTALEKKWAEEAVKHVPSLEDAYTAEGFKPDMLDETVIDRIPTPTGWRIAILPYRGAEKTKGGIALSDPAQAAGFDGVWLCLEDWSARVRRRGQVPDRPVVQKG